MPTRVKPLTETEVRVLDTITYRAKTIGSVALHTDLTRDKAQRVLGGLIARGLVDELDGHYSRRP